MSEDGELLGQMGEFRQLQSQVGEQLVAGAGRKSPATGLAVQQQIDVGPHAGLKGEISCLWRQERRPRHGRRSPPRPDLPS